MFTAYPPSRGRLSEYAEALVSALRKRGVTVLVLSDSSSGSKLSPKVWSINKPVNPLSVFREIARFRPNVLHFNLHYAVFGRGRLINFLGFIGVFLSAALARILGTKCLVTLHNVPEAIDLGSYSIKNRFYNRIGFETARRLVSALCPIVVTLKLYARLLSSLGIRNIYWVPHGSWPITPPDDPAPRDTVLFIGHISPSKDLGALAEAVKLLRTRGLSLKLVVAGAPHPSFEREGEEQLKSLASQQGVSYVGYVRWEQLPSLLSRALCVVLPYKTPTGSSGVLHLVSGAGLPVVAVGSPEFRELARDGAGLLLTGRSPEEIADAIAKLMDEATWRKCSEKSRRYSEKRSWDRVAEMYLEIYGRLRG